VVCTNALELGVDVGRTRRGGADRRAADAGQCVAAGGPRRTRRRSGAGDPGRLQRNGGPVPDASSRLISSALAGGGRDRPAQSVHPGAAARLRGVRAAARGLRPAAFGPQTTDILAALEDAGETRTIDGRAYWAKTEFPAAKVNLRTISDDTYTIMDMRGPETPNAVIGTVDAISALELVYPEAIYLHEGETCFVRELDLEQKIAFVERREVDYYTQPVPRHQYSVCAASAARGWRGQLVLLGDVTYRGRPSR
jgi:DEAD/DEAH box helicase domain-containing protein